MTTDRHGITVLDARDCWDLLRQAEVGRRLSTTRQRSSRSTSSSIETRSCSAAHRDEAGRCDRGSHRRFRGRRLRAGSRRGLERHHQGAGYRDRAKRRGLRGDASSPLSLACRAEAPLREDRASRSERSPIPRHRQGHLGDPSPHGGHQPRVGRVWLRDCRRNGWGFRPEPARAGRPARLS